VLVLGREGGVLAGSRDGLPGLLERRVGRVREPEATAGDQPDPEAAGLGEREALDLGPARLGLGPAGLLRVGLDRLAVPGGPDRRRTQVEQVRHRCPPP
jgi:hypothetical protein